MLSTRDVDTAFLQSDPFPETDVRYVRIRSPIDGKTRYYRQYKPIYGSCSAPVRWQKTFVNWLTKPEAEGGAGLVRGHNEPCVLTELGIGQPPGSSHIFNERQQFRPKPRF